MQLRKGVLFAGLMITGMFLFSRLYQLDRLPVFADEAIYIRWAQMIADEPKRHMFLPLFDGKTPLQMWLLTWFLRLNWSEPVVYSRLLSVTAGLITLGTLTLITKRLGGRRAARIGAGVLYLVLPFTFFHDRMALTDTVYVMFLSLTFYSLLRLKEVLNWQWTIISGLCFGAAILTKLPGLLFLLEFLLILWLMPPLLNQHKQKRAAVLFGAAAGIGAVMLYVLRVSELFPFLFQRGGDFTFTPMEIIRGEWRFVIFNWQRYFRWQTWYATAGLWLLILSVFVIRKIRITAQARLVGSLTIMVLAAGIYFIIFGRIVFSRYYLPSVIFLIPAGALAGELLWQARKGWLVGIGAALIFIQAVWFIKPWYTDLNQVKLEKEDRQQYLTEWSSGFGNLEVANYLKDRAADNRVALATEGFFGTLPDGISIYFDHTQLNNQVEIFGVGQPITGLPDQVRDKALNMETYLAVNQHRLDFDTSECCSLIQSYPRPYGGPPLLLFKVKN